MPAVDSPAEEFLQLYGPEAWKDWRRMLTHFDWSEGFAFLVLLLPGAAGASICRRQLTEHLKARSKQLTVLPCEGPEHVRRLPDRLLDLQSTPDMGGIWIGSVVADSDAQIRQWKEAWRIGLAALNQHRNPLRERFAYPLVLVGAPWLAPLLREAAPDLWSVRTGVVQVTPAPEPLPGAERRELIESPFQVKTGEAAADPDYALEQAARLRGKARAEATLADLLLQAGNGFADRARYEEAEKCFGEASRLYAKLAPQSPERIRDWAGTLMNWANSLSYLNQHEQALSTAEQAAQVFRQLAYPASKPLFQRLLARAIIPLSRVLPKRFETTQQSSTDSSAFLPDLAMSLNSLAAKLGDLGRHEEALTKTQEALRIYEQLAKARPDAFLPELALSLNNLGNRLGDLGRREDALAKAQEAVRIREQLAKARPDAFLPDLAMSLNNLGNRLGDLGRREEALTKTQEALRIYEQLAKVRPDAFLPDQAMSLHNLASSLSDLGRHKDALEKAQEALRIYEQLAKARHDAFLPYLAASLNNLTTMLSALGRREEALDKAQEAVRIFQQLAKSRPDAFLPDLAMSLNNLANCLGVLGRREEALAKAQEAVRIREQLAKARPDVFLPELARSCGARGNILSGMDRNREAANSFRAGIEALSPGFMKTPEAFGGLMATLAKSYVDSTKKAGLKPDEKLLEPISSTLQKLQDDAKK